MSSTRTEITQARRSVRLVTWARAWRAGTVSYDDVADETERDEEHLVADAPDTWTDIPLREAVRVMSRLHPDEIRLVLPAPGDPRGLPGPGPFTGHALAAGEAVVAGQLGLVPEVREHTSGSGDTFSIVVWQTFPLTIEPFVAAAPDEPAQAEAELSEATADAVTALSRLDVAAWRPELAGALAALRKPDHSTDLPPGFTPRARRLFARATVVDRVLALAAAAGPGDAVNGFEAQRRDVALRPLNAACRRALMAACNSPLEP
jgi:hypothetical protein